MQRHKRSQAGGERGGRFSRSGYQRWEGGWVWWQTNHSSCQILTDIPSLVRSAHAASQTVPLFFLTFPHNLHQDHSQPRKPHHASFPQRILTHASSRGLLSPTRNGSPHHSPPSVSMSPNFFLPWVFLFFKHSELLWSHYVLERKYNFTEWIQFNFPDSSLQKQAGGMPFTSAGQQNLLWCWKGPLSALSNTAAPGRGWVMGTWNVVLLLGVQSCNLV